MRQKHWIRVPPTPKSYTCTENAYVNVVVEAGKFNGLPRESCIQARLIPDKEGERRASGVLERRRERYSSQQTT
jgi:hypothetical protein